MAVPPLLPPTSVLDSTATDAVAGRGPATTESFYTGTHLARAVTPSPFAYVLLDMDGTLVDEKSSWAWVHDHFEVDNEANLEAYLAGRFDDETFIEADVALWQAANGGPVRLGTVDAILDEAPLMPGADALADALARLELPAAIVSGGIDRLADRVADALGLEVALANGLETDAEGHLTGRGTCRVRLKDKGSPSLDVLDAWGLAPGEGIAVGNSRFDVPMFDVAGTGVAFAPVDERVRTAADVVFEAKDLAELVPVLEQGVPA